MSSVHAYELFTGLSFLRGCEPQRQRHRPYGPTGYRFGSSERKNYEKIYDSIAGLKTGDTLAITVFRGGKVLK